MDRTKSLTIKEDDGLFFITKTVYITEDEEKQIIDLLKSYKLHPTKVECKTDITRFIIGGFIFYLLERYALNHTFNEIEKKIKAILLKNLRRQRELEANKKEIK